MSFEDLEKYNRIREHESKIAQLWNEYERLLKEKQEALENNIKILRITCEKLYDSASENAQYNLQGKTIFEFTKLVQNLEIIQNENIRDTLRNLNLGGKGELQSTEMQNATSADATSTSTQRLW